MLDVRAFTITSGSHGWHQVVLRSLMVSGLLSQYDASCTDMNDDSNQYLNVVMMCVSMCAGSDSL